MILVCLEKSWLTFVPAAAVKRRGQVLFIVIGRKGIKFAFYDIFL